MNIGLNNTNTHKINFKSSLLAQMMQKTSVSSQPVAAASNTPVLPAAYSPVSTPVADRYTQYSKGSLLAAMLGRNQRPASVKDTWTDVNLYKRILSDNRQDEIISSSYT